MFLNNFIILLVYFFCDLHLIKIQSKLNESQYIVTVLDKSELASPKEEMTKNRSEGILY